MIVTIRTEYIETVRKILRDEEIIRECTVILQDDLTLVITCHDDRDYRSINNWIGDAVGACLIHGHNIARL